MRWLPGNKYGFTLIELMIVILVSSIIMLGVFAIYNGQTKMQKNESISLDMMQNLRAGFYQMDRDIRVAGFDPLSTANAGITRANLSDIQFTIDNNMDGVLINGASGEQIRYFLSSDTNGDGIADGGAGGTLQRQEWAATADTLSNNIEALMFFYFDVNGNLLNSPMFGNVPAGNLGSIATVEVAMIARGPGIMGGYRNTASYSITLPSGATQTIFTAPGDNVKRELLTSAIRCRNLQM